MTELVIQSPNSLNNNESNNNKKESNLDINKLNKEENITPKICPEKCNCPECSEDEHTDCELCENCKCRCECDENFEDDEDDEYSDDEEKEDETSYKENCWNISDLSTIQEKENETSYKLIYKDYKGYDKTFVDLFVNKWEKQFVRKPIKGESLAYADESCNITNIHGIKFHNYSIQCFDNRGFSFNFHAYKNIDNINPYIENDEDDECRHLYNIHTHAKTLHDAFINILNKINECIFCKHCGEIHSEELFYKDLNKCQNCCLNDLLYSKRLTSEHCTICLESTKNYYTLRCGHKFHRACLSDIKDSTKKCPNCRKFINEEDEEIYNENEEFNRHVHDDD